MSEVLSIVVVAFSLPVLILAANLAIDYRVYRQRLQRDYGLRER